MFTLINNGGKISSFKKLLERDGSAPIHNRNLQILVTEMFKVYNIKDLPTFTEIFNKQNPNYQYVTLRTFQIHLLEVYIMELKAYRF